MRVLAHIHTFNDADIIDGTIEAVRYQTRPVDGILVVDNASTTARWIDPRCARRVLRHPENRGTSGAVYQRLSLCDRTRIRLDLAVRRRQSARAAGSRDLARSL